jgi:hypothetical protein
MVLMGMKAYDLPHKGSMQPLWTLAETDYVVDSLGLVASSGIEPELSALRVGYRGPKGISNLAALTKAV